MYTEGLVSIAKRENNTRRAYLVVNRLQGKHIPVEPGQALGMFWALGEKVRERYQGQPLLLVGFAETATAIGAAAAVGLGAYYIQTTREKIPGVEYLYFSESHSHATEQKLVKDDLDPIIEKVSRIVFIEDEVTTGNTILKIVHLIRSHYGERVCFSVASILNGMDLQSQERYRTEGIDMLYLVKTDHSRYTEIAGRFAGNGVYHQPVISYQETMAENPLQRTGAEASYQGTGAEVTFTVRMGRSHVQQIDIPGIQDARRLVQGAAYQNACQQLWEGVQPYVPHGGNKNILVLGTEEFMYPPLFAAWKMQQSGHKVKYHATTRSPIAVSLEPEYPLHERYQLASLYDRGRKTFVYDLARYDVVFILTDAPGDQGENEEAGNPSGLDFLEGALRACGNETIYCVRWC